MSPEAAENSVPIYILTGLLGSGKTSLLQHLISQENLKFIVIQNELSEEMGIESPMIMNGPLSYYELPNGCLCCSSKDGLVNALEESVELMKRKNADSKFTIDGILIECTGVADPQKLAEMFWEFHLNENLKLHGVLCLIDASSIQKILNGEKWPDLKEIAVKQIAVSDLIILNKIDLVEKYAITDIEKQLNDLVGLSASPTLLTEHGKVDFNQVSTLLKQSSSYEPTGNFPELPNSNEVESTSHKKSLTVEHIFVKKALSHDTRLTVNEVTKRVGSLLWESFPSSEIYRCKGLLLGLSDDDNPSWIAFQGVGELLDVKIVYPSHLESSEFTCRMLFVGKNLDSQKIHSIFS
jgi:G3E family GTPase